MTEKLQLPVMKKLRTDESFDSPEKKEERKSTGVDGRTLSKPTTVLASASVVNAIDHHSTDDEERKHEAETQEEYESEKKQE